MSFIDLVVNNYENSCDHFMRVQFESTDEYFTHMSEKLCKVVKNAK